VCKKFMLHSTSANQLYLTDELLAQCENFQKIITLSAVHHKHLSVEGVAQLHVGGGVNSS